MGCGVIARQFADRREAGRQLADALEHLRGEDLVIFGLARGGVVVAHEVARRLEAPLDVLVARKLGAPIQPELAIGAVAHGASVLRHDIVEMLGISDEEIAAITAAAATVAHRPGGTSGRARERAGVPRRGR